MDNRTLQDAISRAAYRAILQREPEAAVLAQQRPEEFGSDLERLIEETLKRFLASDERRVLERQFSPGAWVITELEHGLKLWVDLADFGVSRACLEGVYEPDETTFLKGILRPGMTFVDIGANIGWYTVHAAQIVGPAGLVIAFEPRPDTFARLSRSVALNGFEAWVELHQAALGATPGQAYVGWHAQTKNPGGTWLLQSELMRSTFEASGAEIYPTCVATLDQIVADRSIDILKIDIEGAEPIALQGAVETLLKSRPTILSEVNFANLQTVSGVSGSDYFQQMTALGYTAYALGRGDMGPTLLEDLSAPDGGLLNVVFVPTERAP